jgi:hypothetical protein
VSAKKRDAVPEPPDRREIAGLLTTIVTSWPNTMRAVLCIVVMAAVLWWLNADLSAGPVSITGRDSHGAPAVSGSAHHSSKR